MDNELKALGILFTEFYYWVTIAFMFLIHAGFCLYEVGISRQKNQLATILKNTMAIPIVTVTFYLFGWWIYFAFTNGPGINGGLVTANFALPWNELMGTHMGGRPFGTDVTAADTALWARLNGVFFGAFLLFSITTASIVSGACIERIKSGAFWILAVLVGSVTWVLAASWGWSATGWMVKLWGFHDAYASGVVHAVAGGAALAAVIVLGPRIGKFKADGTPVNIPPANVWMTTVGLFLIFTGFWGFYVACNIPMWDINPDPNQTFFSATNIYLSPTTLSAITFNFLLAFSGGLMAGYFVSKGDTYWTYSGGLAGIIATSSGNDLYHPIQAFLLAGLGVIVIYKLHYWVERKFKLDDAVGAAAVHGYSGVFALIAAGFMLWGYPSGPELGAAVTTPWGNAAGAVVCFLFLGFIPTYVVAKALDAFGLLRHSKEVELAGLDYLENRTERLETQVIIETDRKYSRELNIDIT